MDRVHIENREQETAYSEPCTDKHTFSVETSPRIQRLRVCESLDYGLHTVPNGNALQKTPGRGFQSETLFDALLVPYTGDLGLCIQFDMNGIAFFPGTTVVCNQALFYLYHSNPSYPNSNHPNYQCTYSGLLGLPLGIPLLAWRCMQSTIWIPYTDCPDQSLDTHPLSAKTSQKVNPKKKRKEKKKKKKNPVTPY